MLVLFTSRVVLDNSNNSNNVLGRDCHVSTIVESYIDRAAVEAGAAAEMAATRKEEKYVDLDARYIFEPIAVDTLGVFNASAPHLLILEGGSRDQLPLPKDFDFNTALQCCPFA